MAYEIHVCNATGPGNSVLVPLAIDEKSLESGDLYPIALPAVKKRTKMFSLQSFRILSMFYASLMLSILYIAELFHHHRDFIHAHKHPCHDMIKSSLFKKPGRKSRFLKFLANFIPSSKVKLDEIHGLQQSDTMPQKFTSMKVFTK